MRVQRRVLTVEGTKFCKQHFLITRRVYKNLNLNLQSRIPGVFLGVPFF